MPTIVKLTAVRQHADSSRARLCIAAVLLSTPIFGCSSNFLGSTGASQGGPPNPPAQARAVTATPTVVATASPSQNGGGSIQLASYQAPPDPPAKEPPGKNGNGDKDGAEKDNKEANKQKITLPMAIEICLNSNFRILAGAENIRMAEGDMITSSLVPNPTLFADYQLIPLRSVDVTDQLGPPQADALVSIPIDWLLFGKRLAAMRAAQLGVEITVSDYADLMRVQLAQAIDGFYEVLEDEAYFKLAEKNLAEIEEFEKVTEDMAKNNQVGALEVDRIKLAVHEAILERHDRELALDLAKAKLRPFLGRTAADPDYEVEGSLTVTAVLDPPTLQEAVALADTHRPDLASGRKSIDQANAIIDRECRKAKPEVSLQPGYTFQNQHFESPFHNGSLFDIGISTTLPFTDRNQGNIVKAQAAARERQLTYEGDRADALVDVEASVANYADSVEHLTLFNTAETMKAAFDLRKNMEIAYRAGDRKLIELLDAQKAYNDRLGHVIEFQSFYWRSLNKLNASVGLKAYDPETRQSQPLGKNGEKK